MFCLHTPSRSIHSRRFALLYFTLLVFLLVAGRGTARRSRPVGHLSARNRHQLNGLDFKQLSVGRRFRYSRWSPVWTGALLKASMDDHQAFLPVDLRRCVAIWIDPIAISRLPTYHCENCWRCISIMKTTSQWFEGLMLAWRHSDVKAPFYGLFRPSETLQALDPLN